MFSKHEDIPFTIIPQSNTRCSIISAITISEDDFISRRNSSRVDYDEYDDDDDEADIEDIEASIEQMVMDMYHRKSVVSAISAVSESTESDAASHDRFGSITGPRTSELLQAMPKPERKPSVNIRLSSVTGSHGHYYHRDSLLQDAQHYDRIPNLPSRRPSEGITRMQSHVSDQTEKSTLVGIQSS
jgi:hypothetical protein